MQKDLGQCKWSGVTEEEDAKGFGSLQVFWSERRGGSKMISAEAGVDKKRDQLL
ncbi:hypothetical protein J2Y03_005698 [Neobacillus niacini]|uniref:hypothetical protein n=1 Tax=Neobacillus niacini TaxID=86668 RepID=UPI002855F4BF|nr:hypothetical protein [Neobacillus niacini]MDR7080611.1 hypothetical protein [Neobacillus niacini]